VLCCVATTLVATALVCLHDVSLMYACCGKCSWSEGRSARTTHVAHVVFSPHKPLHIVLTPPDSHHSEGSCCVGSQNVPADMQAIADMSFRVETRRVYVCTHEDCDKKYSRMLDLRRHDREAHQDDRRFKCRALGYERAVRGFPRRDKRDIHERKMHVGIGNGIFPPNEEPLELLGRDFSLLWALCEFLIVCVS
jgi:hypothetical protein